MPNIVKTSIKCAQFILAIGALVSIVNNITVSYKLFNVVINTTLSSRYMADPSVIFYAAISVFTLGSFIASFIVWFFALYQSSEFKVARKYLPLFFNSLMTLLWCAGGFTLIPIHLEARDNRDAVSQQISSLESSQFSGILSGLPSNDEFNTKLELWTTAVESSLSAILLGVFLFVSYLAFTILLFFQLGGRTGSKVNILRIWKRERNMRPAMKPKKKEKKKANIPISIRTSSRNLGKLDTTPSLSMVFSPRLIRSERSPGIPPVSARSGGSGSGGSNDSPLPPSTTV
jgi:hypothetical protein